MRKRYWILAAMVAYAMFKGGADEHRSPATAHLENPSVVPEVQPVAPSPEPVVRNSSRVVVAPKPPPKEISQPLQPSPAYQVRFVRGSRVAFRAGPSTDYPIIDRFDAGREVVVLEQTSDWSHVRDKLTQRDGWMASRFLKDEPADRQEDRPRPQPQKPRKVAPPSVPVQSDSIVIQRIIAESLAAYPGSCPCPYNTDRGGRACGRRSAYSKPGGYSPICYPADVSQSMIEAYRRR